MKYIIFEAFLCKTMSTQLNIRCQVRSINIRDNIFHNSSWDIVLTNLVTLRTVLVNIKMLYFQFVGNPWRNVRTQSSQQAFVKVFVITIRLQNIDTGIVAQSHRIVVIGEVIPQSQQVFRIDLPIQTQKTGI